MFKVFLIISIVVNLKLLFSLIFLEILFYTMMVCSEKNGLVLKHYLLFLRPFILNYFPFSSYKACLLFKLLLGSLSIIKQHTKKTLLLPENFSI